MSTASNDQLYHQPQDELTDLGDWSGRRATAAFCRHVFQCRAIFGLLAITAAELLQRWPWNTL